MAIALVMAEAETMGVEMDVVHEDGAIWLSNLVRSGGRPGSGEKALASLIEIADDHGLPIRASVVRDHERLMEYYSGLGFEPVSQSCGPDGRNYRITIEYAP